MRAFVFLSLAAIINSLQANVSVFSRCNEDEISRLPLNLPSAQGVVHSEGEAMAIARCYETCPEERNVTSPFTIISSLSCGSEIAKVLECRRGCLVMASDPQQTVTDCRHECKVQCDGELSVNYTGSDCPISCRRPPCKKGCQNYGGSPVPLLTAIPVSPPILAREPRKGHFSINYSLPLDSNSSVAAFIFRVEIDSSSTVRYTTQTSISDFLDIGVFACREVNISFIALSSDSLTTQIPPTYLPLSMNMYIHGDSYPSQLRGTVGTTVEEDVRVEFQQTRRAHITIEWKTPERIEFATGYELILTSTRSDECGGRNRERVFFIKDKNTTSLRISAETPSDMPAFSQSDLPSSACTYQAMVIVHPLRDGDNPASLHLQLSQDNVNIQKFELKCSNEFDKETGLITATLQWQIIPFNLPIKLETIFSINIFERKLLVDIENDILEDGFMFDPILPIAAESEYNKSVLGDFVSVAVSLDQNASGVFIVRNIIPSATTNREFKIRVQRNFDFYYRDVPNPANCTVDTLPPPSDPVAIETMEIREFSLLGKMMNLTMQWALPEDTFGMIGKSEIRVTALLQLSEQEIVNDTDLIIHRIINNPKTEFILSNERVAIEDNSTCLFIQVRLHNMFLWSEWSDPLILPRDESVSGNCTFIVRSKPPTPFWIFIASGSGVLVLVIMSLALVLTVVLCLNWRRRRQLKALLEGPKIILPGIMNPSSGDYIPTSFSLAPNHMNKPDKWEIYPSEILLGEEIGKGFFGTVYKGLVNREAHTSTTDYSQSQAMVAVKMMRAKVTTSEKAQFLDEIILMKMIAEGDNPHVVKMVGCVMASEPLCLLTEYVSYGDLLSYLKSIKSMVSQAYKRASTSYYSDGYASSQRMDAHLSVTTADSTSQSYQGSLLSVITPRSNSSYAKLGQVETMDLISFAYQIASGMEYISGLNIVHRDLACRNILLGEGKSVKIADFGMSRLVKEDNPIYTKTSHGHLPWKWMAMESIQDMEFTSASDVWSFGVIMWEIASLGGYPYHSVQNNELLQYLISGQRLNCPKNCKKSIYQIMMSCWEEDPSLRPNFSQLKLQFKKFMEEKLEVIAFPSAEDEFEANHSPIIGLGISEDGSTVAPGRARSASLSAKDLLEVEMSERLTRPVSAPSLNREEGESLDLEPPQSRRYHKSINPYVRTPKHDSIFEIQKNQHGWNRQKVPRILVSASEET